MAATARAGIHGTSRGVGIHGAGEQGKRFTNGSSWDDHRLGDVSGHLGCYTIDTANDVSNCTQHNGTGSGSRTPTYYYHLGVKSLLRRTALFLALLLLVLPSAACAPKKEPPAPRPQTMVLSERNRQVWLSMSDEDLLDHSVPAWRAVAAASPVRSVDVTRTLVDTLYRTGLSAGMYYQKRVTGPGFKDAEGLVIVLRSGEVDRAGAGRRPLARYGSPALIGPSAKLRDDDLAALTQRTLRRMGLAIEALPAAPAARRPSRVERVHVAAGSRGQACDHGVHRSAARRLRAPGARAAHDLASEAEVNRVRCTCST